MGKKRKDASKRDEAVIKKEEGKSATSSGANAAEAARAPAGGKDNTKASGAGDDEGKAGQQEDVSGSSGGAACMFLFLVLGLVTAATVMAAYAAEDMQFADMPSEVQSWLETGHYIPVRLHGKDHSVFVAKLLDKSASETVLLVPDVHTTSFSYREVAKKLHAQGMSVVAFDFPGFGLSKTPPPALYTHTDETAAAFIGKLFKSVSLRSVHLVLQGSSAAAGVAFTETNRAKVRSMTLVGVDTAGRSSFTTPPLFESAFGHTFATRVPGVNWATLAWFRSKAAQTFTADLLQAYTFLNAYNDGEEAYLAALRKAEALHGIGAPAGECDGNHDGDHGGHSHGHESHATAHDHHHDEHHHHHDANDANGAGEDSFATKVKDLVVPAMTVWISEGEGGAKAGGGFKLWTSKKNVGRDDSSLGFPAEEQPEVFADVVSKFVAAQEPTPKAAAPPIPEHIQRQLDAGHGHTHGHGGGGGHHGHSHGH